MTDQTKQQIKTKLSEYCGRYSSQNLAANTLKSVSAATISQILNGKWDKIADEMWRNIASQIGVSDWNRVETSCFNLITETFADAQKYANVYGVTAKAGSGKTFAARDYARTHQNAHHIICCEWWTIKLFFSEILRTMGLESKISYNDNALTMSAISQAIREQQTPVLIFDEVDKLTDRIFCGLISVCNELEDICGIILMATDNLSSRIEAGVRSNKKGYNELYSRLGRKFIKVTNNKQDDIAKVCIANGVTDRYEIDKITSDCEFDLRRVKRFIHSYKILNNGTGN